MCGVASIFRFDGQPVDPADLRRMGSAIAHRGPDDAGFALLAHGTVGLAHVRLSIVDLGGGHQPLYNEDRSIAVVCNGEIYDYPRLHAELVAHGHRARNPIPS
jgi:asparagine synthase (glutamine-hydrolysing)